MWTVLSSLVKSHWNEYLNNVEQFQKLSNSLMSILIVQTVKHLLEDYFNWRKQSMYVSIQPYLCYFCFRLLRLKESKAFVYTFQMIDHNGKWLPERRLKRWTGWVIVQKIVPNTNKIFSSLIFVHRPFYHRPFCPGIPRYGKPL